MLLPSISFTTLLLGVSCISTADAQWHEHHGVGSAPLLNNGEEIAGPNTLGRSVLLSHAIIASAVWVLLIPAAGILLRLNIRSPWVLRAHATLQVTSYLLFIAAVGLGAWLANRMSSEFGSLWSDAHPVLGLVILVLALAQPVLGTVHHRLFKERVAAAKEFRPGPAPGRTVSGHVHLWLGRILIVLGVVNGGLGIRLTRMYPFQSLESTKKAGYVYGSVAGAMFLLYLIIVIRFERKKAKRDQEAVYRVDPPMVMSETPPTYEESMASVQKNETGAIEYR